MKFQVELKYHLPAHKDCIYTCLKLNDHSFLTAGGDGQLLKWDLNDTSSAKLLARTDASIYFLEHINQNIIAIGTNAGDLYFYNHLEKQITSKFNIGYGIFTGVGVDDKLILGSADGVLTTISTTENVIENSIKVSEGHIRNITILEKGQFVAATSANEILILDKRIEVVHRISNAHNDSVFSLLRINEQVFLSGGKDAILKLWSASSYQPILEIPAHLFAINHLLKLGISGRIISASRDKSIKIWDPETLLLEKVIDRSKIELASSHSVNKLLFLNSGLLVSVGDDRIVRIYEIKEA